MKPPLSRFPLALTCGVGKKKSNEPEIKELKFISQRERAMNPRFFAMEGGSSYPRSDGFADHVVVPKFAVLVPENGVGLEGERHDVLAAAVENDEVAILHERGGRHGRHDSHRDSCSSSGLLHRLKLF
jgi:hypothetical protein